MPELPAFDDIRRDLTSALQPPPDQWLQLPADVHAALRHMPDAAAFITKAVRRSQGYLSWYEQLAPAEQRRARETLRRWTGRLPGNLENHEISSSED